MDKMVKLDLITEYFSKISPHEMVAVSDYDGKYLFCTDSFAALFGLTQKEMLGLRLREINNEYCQSAAKTSRPFLNFTLKKSLSRVVTLYSMQTVDGVKLFFVDATEIEGIGFKVTHSEMPIGIIGDVLYLIQQISVVNSSKVHTKLHINKSPKVILSSREEEILFLLSIGKTYKEIALILSEIYTAEEITPGQISRMVSNVLFEKFNCFNSFDLVQQYLSHSNMSTIPSQLLAQYQQLLGVLTFHGFTEK